MGLRAAPRDEDASWGGVGGVDAPEGRGGASSMVAWLGLGLGLGLGPGLGLGLGGGFGFGFGLGLGLDLGSPAWLVEMTRKEWRLEATSASAMLIRAG